ncbi:ELM1/GtrOC1 family putative glycosyltransferase [Aquirhabdus parva]|uniref:Nucleoside-diphosphate sugar epimerase n=1 Tax=Aquirhabdus parva TaxID=2283318 RepID=A0A345P747_9GAMM|nr:ELM1/GtrOC1 family putative glycosyltransferase [Aquirhabdus parva]AXI03106.1 nucleoside-diphosphate sugar epimerase [Aquirhabdus parva]
MVMNIWHLSDGKAGHVAQARGLFVALERRDITIHVEDISVKGISKFSLLLYWLSHGRLGQLPQSLMRLHEPDLIVGVGHATHWILILLQKCFPAAKSVVLMRPTLPANWFDYAIVPAHDYSDQNPSVPDHVLISKGVLNPLINEHRHIAHRHLILIGGASKRYDWSEAQLIKQINDLVSNLSQKDQAQTIILTTSRRTPDSFVSHLSQQNLPHLQIFPVSETPQGWLFEQLQLAEIVWVTQDSGSMLFEALTAGCQVGLLKMPQIKKDTVTQATDLLAEQHIFLPLAEYLKGEGFNNAEPLREADRAVDWLLTKLDRIN